MEMTKIIFGYVSTIKNIKNLIIFWYGQLLNETPNYTKITKQYPSFIEWYPMKKSY